MQKKLSKNKLSQILYYCGNKLPDMKIFTSGLRHDRVNCSCHTRFQHFQLQEVHFGRSTCTEYGSQDYWHRKWRLFASRQSRWITSAWTRYHERFLLFHLANPRGISSVKLGLDSFKNRSIRLRFWFLVMGFGSSWFWSLLGFFMLWVLTKTRYSCS